MKQLTQDKILSISKVYGELIDTINKCGIYDLDVLGVSTLYAAITIAKEDGFTLDRFLTLIKTSWKTVPNKRKTTFEA